jgi:hypothetical protein
MEKGRRATYGRARGTSVGFFWRVGYWRWERTHGTAQADGAGGSLRGSVWTGVRGELASEVLAR